VWRTGRMGIPSRSQLLGASPRGVPSLSTTVDRGDVVSFECRVHAMFVGRGGEGVRRRKFTRGADHLN
jgi:hypothetical protein